MDVWSISKEVDLVDRNEKVVEAEATNSSAPYFSKMFKPKRTFQDVTTPWYENKEPWYKEAVENMLAIKCMCDLCPFIQFHLYAFNNRSWIKET